MTLAVNDFTSFILGSQKYSWEIFQCYCMLYNYLLLAHLSRMLMGELIVYRSSRRPSVRASVRVSTLSNMNISKTNGSIATKLYLKHHWDGGLNALGFGPDRITLVSMATESSHRVIMVETVSPLFLGCFSSDPFSYLQVTKTCMRARTSSNFSLIGPQTEELAALERLKKSP